MPHQHRARPDPAADQQLIAEFIRTRGVTRCPVAMAVPTSADIPPADAAIHRARGLDPMGDVWRKGSIGLAYARSRQRAAAASANKRHAER